MAPNTERIQFLRAVRQLHRVRSFYLLAVFTGLLATAGLSLRRLAVPPTGRPAHHAASHKAARTRHAHA
ncbi:hypothetical protein ACFXAE_35780 [Streptomyces sp. NPDC059454]|uniref:hypothetical protein n=1 Tax=Streptomyces sp. NPDC059454 TaxID=3346836 RepID=UPI0036B96E10